ncbi:hypothetical protein M501DRAFT_1004530 [Patellaria atrata CBS 101060]|uniref:Uncharacterized protein n=1 Tax=Patellaria atrata CBS 101060 TaxID=1346257 RepID=A0A9P4SA16_9PEZI|nr:hypothetical protein M501DRAFT_1004530 [Patellaria atrata CBS 101060]
MGCFDVCISHPVKKFYVISPFILYTGPRYVGLYFEFAIICGSRCSINSNHRTVTSQPTIID